MSTPNAILHNIDATDSLSGYMYVVFGYFSVPNFLSVDKTEAACHGGTNDPKIANDRLMGVFRDLQPKVSLFG